MPDQGGYLLPQDISDEILKEKVVGFPAFRLGGMTFEQEAKLNELSQKVDNLNATCNQIKALLWQIVLKQQGITLILQPEDTNDINSLISASGIVLSDK